MSDSPLAGKVGLPEGTAQCSNVQTKHTTIKFITKDHLKCVCMYVCINRYISMYLYIHTHRIIDY